MFLVAAVVLSFGGLTAGDVDRDNGSRKALGEEEQQHPMMPIGLGQGPMGTGSGYDFENEEEDKTAQDAIALMSLFQGNFADCGLDLNRFIGTGDGDPSVILDFFQLSPDCTASEQGSMRQAFWNFAECSGYDELLLREDVFGALLGVAMKCISSMKLLDFATMNVPEDCAIALFGNHPLGKMLRDELLYPGKTAVCFATLADELPQCSVDLWPFPVDAKTARMGACLGSKMEKIWTEQCLLGLKDFQTCLPAVSELSPSNCGSYSNACVEAGQPYFTRFVMSMPETLLGMPLPDSCVQQASPKGLSSAVDQYEVFRTSCASAGKALWERLKVPEDDPKDPSLTTFTQFLSKDSSGNGIGDSTEALQAPKLSMHDPNGAGPGRTSRGFIGGFLTGVVLVLGVFSVASFLRKKTRTDGGPGYVELSHNYNIDRNGFA